MLASRFLHPTSRDPGGRESLGHRLFRVSGRVPRPHRGRATSGCCTSPWTTACRSWSLRSLSAGGSLALMPLVGVELMPAERRGRGARRRRDGGRARAWTSWTRRSSPIEEIVAPRGARRPSNVVTSIGGRRLARQRLAHRRACGSPSSRRRERTRSSEEIAAALRRKLAGIPGATIRTRAGQGLFLLRMVSGGRNSVQVEIRGYDLETADALAQRGRGRSSRTSPASPTPGSAATPAAPEGADRRRPRTRPPP